jgi:hypothetical protein
MSTTTKIVLTLIGIVAGFWIVSKLLGLLVGTALWLLGLVAPVLVIGALGYLGYWYVSKKVIGSTGRRSLP